MTFNDPVQYPDGHDSEAPTLVRWESAAGHWRIQIDPVLYGVRLHLLHDYHRQFWMSYEVVYCMGRARMTILLLPRIMLKILADVDEMTATPADVRKLFPQQRRRPMENDADCWRELCQAAGIPELSADQLINSGKIPWPDPLALIAPPPTHTAQRDSRGRQI